MITNLFIDTEFTCFETATMQLISIGIVSEDGNHEFYRENTSHNADFRSDFVNKIVIPLLEGGSYAKAWDWIALDLKEWIDTLPGDEVCFICDYVGDWHLTDPLLKKHQQSKKVGAMMYNQAFIHRLYEFGVHTEAKLDDAMRDLMYNEGDSYFSIDPRQHHSLVDAKASRHAWMRGLKAGLK